MRAMTPFMRRDFGNPSSTHAFGQTALHAIDDAKVAVAELLHCRPYDIVFTSGATEANNLALLGTLVAGDHLITTAIEHPSVREPAKELERRGVMVSWVKPEADGRVRAEHVLAEVRAETKLVSVMYANNEIGTIQPIVEIGEGIAELNAARRTEGLPPILFHTDAVQAAGFCPLSVDQLGVDLLSLSAHKLYGPKGVGVLFVREGTKLQSLMFGGAQQSSLRPGTLPPPLIVGCGAAAKLVRSTASQREIARMTKLRDQLYHLIQRQIPDVELTGDPILRLPNHLHLRFPNVDGENLAIVLDQLGLACSVGSACASGALEPSYVLEALGLSTLEIRGSLRVTLGRPTRAADIKRASRLITTAVAQLRSPSAL
jgi:cysteine desulfurase